MRERQMAKCHPDRPQKARGLCRSCYGTALRKGTLAHHEATLVRVEGMSVCHPDRPVYNATQGLCCACYQMWRAAQNPALAEKNRVSSREYHRHKRSTQAGRAHLLQNQRQWRDQHRDRQRRNDKNGTMLRKYGLSLDEAEVMLSSQGGKCPICGTVLERWHVDHDHRTGLVRQLLCPLCNVGLGSFKDSPDRLLAAADYLRKWATPSLALQS